MHRLTAIESLGGGREEERDAGTCLFPQANQTGSATTTTTTQYDALGREVSANYTDGLTPNRIWAYDVAYSWPQPSTNLKGRLAVTGGGAGATWNGAAYSYDVMGRVTNLWQCAPATCGTSNQGSRPLTFAYDWLGNLTRTSDAAGGTILYGRSIAGEVNSVTNQTYTNLPYNPPNLVTNWSTARTVRSATRRGTD